MKLLDIYPGDGKPTKREKDIFNDVLDRVGGDQPVMVELGCYNAYWSLMFRERFPSGWSILNDIDGNHLRVGIDNFKLNGFVWGKDYAYNLLDAREYNTIFTVDYMSILHIDIQGAELEFLQKADLSNVKNIVVATHSNKIHKQCKELLKDFTIYVDLPYGSIGGDGFLVGGC